MGANCRLQHSRCSLLLRRVPEHFHSLPTERVAAGRREVKIEGERVQLMLSWLVQHALAGACPRGRKRIKCVLPCLSHVARREKKREKV